jgi:Predicted metal binding domain
LTVEALVDPTVSKTKFDRELAQFREFEDVYREKGWWMLRSKFPEVTVAFASPKLTPAAVIFGVDIDFENYDLWPPSVRLVNPFTRIPYTHAQLPTRMPRMVPIQGFPRQPAPMVAQEMLVAHRPDQIPFLCLPGVREYHNHPAHTGDSWLLHRARGEGTLHFILTQLHKYGIEPINGYEFGWNITIKSFAVDPGSVPQ